MKCNSVYSINQTKKLGMLMVCFFLLGFLRSQQIIHSEGGQKIKIFDDGSYAIIPQDQESTIFLASIASLPKDERISAQVKIIEAEYFVLLYNLQKAVDLLDLSIIQAQKEENKQLVLDYRNKRKELRGKIKDSEGLYDNALYNYNLAAKLGKASEKNKIKWENKVEEYITGKDYIFKTSKYRDDASQEWLAYDAKSFETKISSPLGGEEKVPVLTVKESLFGQDCFFTEETLGENHTYIQSFADLFFYTPERLKSFLKHENLVHGSTRLRKNDQNFYLDLQIVIHSKDAAKSYGHIAEGSLLRIEFVNGIRMNMKANQTTLGRIEEYSGKVYYVFSFLLDKEMLKQLELLPVDYVGVMWTTGYEKYEVFEVDRLMRQVQCFKNIKN